MRTERSTSTRCFGILTFLCLAFFFAYGQNPTKIRSMGPDWSPDGKSLAYYSNRDGNNEIYLLDLQSMESKRITNNNRSDVLPKFSPDGRRILFFSGDKGKHQLFMLNLDSMEETQITEVPSNEDPNWSSDGKSVIFNSNKSGNFEIYLKDIQGEREIKLTDNPLRDFTPEISPDGQMAIFVRGELGKNTSFYLVDLKNMSETKLTDLGNDGYTPVWSHDSSKIYYMHRGESNDIYVWDLEARQATQITKHPSSDIFPASSPDGKQIAFVSNRDSGYELYVMNLETRLIKRLTFDSRN